MAEKTLKQVCHCEKCGNEAEMIVTCQLEPVETDAPSPAPKSKDPQSGDKEKVKGHAVCSHCGNEADMWIDPEHAR